MIKNYPLLVLSRAMLLVANCLSILALLVLPGMATSAPDSAPIQKIDSKKIYQKYCSVCHGDKGNGDTRAAGGLNPKPRNFSSDDSAKELSRQRMIASVTNGRPGTAMVGHAKKLSAQQIESVVDFIRTSFMKLPGSAVINLSPNSSRDQNAEILKPTQHERGRMDAMPVPRAGQDASEVIAGDMKLPMPKKLKGNALEGQAFYMKNCFVCHGVKGDGNGPRAYFIAPRPRNFTNDQSRLMYDRPRLFEAINNGKRGTVMPAWGKVLTDQQIANVAEFVFQAFIRGTMKISVPGQLVDEQKKKDR